MNELDLEKLKRELDDVSGSSCYDVDDIMREAGVSEQEPDQHDLEQLMQRFGIRVEETGTAPQSGTQGQAVPVTQEMMPETPQSDSFAALYRAAQQTQDLVDQQDELAREAKGEPEDDDPLAEQDDVFAQLFAQLGEIEQNTVDDMFAKPEGHTQTKFIDPRIEPEDEPEDEPDLMVRLFDQMDLPQMEKPETEKSSFASDYSEGIQPVSVHIDEKPDVRRDVTETIQPETEVFQPTVEQETQVFQLDEPEKAELPSETETSATTEDNPAEQPEKKGFWSKWFGADDEGDDETEDISGTTAEPAAPQPDMEIFQSALKPKTQVLQPDEPEEAQSADQPEEPEVSKDEPAEQPEKKGFWSKWFGANDEDDDEAEDISETAAEPVAAQPDMEIFQSALKPKTQVLQPDEPEEAQPADESEEPEASEDEPAEQPEKKGFWSKWFGADDEGDDETEGISETEAEPAAAQPEQSRIEEEEAPDAEPVDLPDEPEEIEVVPQPAYVDILSEGIEDAGIAAFEDAMAQEEAIDTTEEIPEPPRPRPEDTPVISEEELEEFLADVQEEDNAPRVSFEQILRDNGMEPEQPEAAPAQQKISLEEFPEEETTVYFDIPLRERTSDEPHHTELFDAEAELEVEPDHAEEPPKPDFDLDFDFDFDPEWLDMPIEQVCELTPPLEELRYEGPVMAREVARQKEWILERRRIYLEEQRAAQQPPEQTETQIAEDDTQPDEDDAIDVAGGLRALLEQEADEEGRDSVFNTGSTDKPETEPAGRETEMTETIISVEASEEPVEEEIQPEAPQLPAEEQPEKAEEKKPRQKPKTKRKKQRAPWPQEQPPHDFDKASKIWRQRARAQAQRSVLVVICTVIAIYISCAADFSILPLPASIDYVQNPSTVLLLFIILQLIAMLISYDVIAEGIQAALHRSPNFCTLVDLALVLNLIHCVARLIWEGEEMPYACVALLALFAQMRARVSNSGARHYIYKVAAGAQQPMGIFCHGRDSKHLVKAPMKNMDTFAAQTVLSAGSRKAERMITILAVIIAVVLSGIVCAATGDIGRLTYVLAATMTGACQIALLSAVPMARNHAARHMMKGGSATDGMDGAWNIASADTIVLTDEDLFPAGSIALERLELRSRLNDTTALAYAAALAGETSLGRMLAEEVRTRYGAPMAAHHAVRYTGGGMGGCIGGLEILLGSADFMAERGVIVSSVPENGLVLAVDGEAAAVLVIDYQVPAAQFNAMQVLTERHIKILLHTRNHQITPQLVERLYGLREGTVLLPDLEHDRALRNEHYLDGDAPCGILLRDGLVPLADFVSTAQAQARLALAGAIIGIGASIICMLLMMYLCYVFVPVDARPIRLLLYMILCFIPIFFIENGVGRE